MNGFVFYFGFENQHDLSGYQVCTNDAVSCYLQNLYLPPKTFFYKFHFFFENILKLKEFEPWIKDVNLGS